MHSTLIHTFSYFRLTEGNIVNKLIHNYISPVHEMVHKSPPNKDWVPWDLSKFSGGFLILCMMLFVGNCVFILEANKKNITKIKL